MLPVLSAVALPYNASCEYVKSGGVRGYYIHFPDGIPRAVYRDISILSELHRLGAEDSVTDVGGDTLDEIAATLDLPTSDVYEGLAHYCIMLKVLFDTSSVEFDVEHVVIGERGFNFEGISMWEEIVESELQVSLIEYDADIVSAGG